MSERMVFTNLWQIDELSKAAIDDLSFGELESNPRGYFRLLSCPLCSDQLAAAITVGEPIGDYKQLDWLYHSVQTNIYLLLDSYNLEEDGLVSLPEGKQSRYLYYVAADALFHSIVASAKIFLDRGQHLIEKYHGKESERYRHWKSITSNAYDSSLVYALMYDLRNKTEHDFWTISLVNIDEINQKAELAINIDNDLMNLGLKQGLIERLKNWASMRTGEEKTAWLSLGKCVKTYQSMIQTLYLICLDALIEVIEKRIEEHRLTLESMPGNYIVWSGKGVLSHSATGQTRVYHTPDVKIIESMKQIQNYNIISKLYLSKDNDSLP